MISLVGAKGFGRAPALLPKCAEAVVRLGVAGFEPDRLGVLDLSGVEPAHALEKAPKIYAILGKVRAERARPTIEALFGLAT